MFLRVTPEKNIVSRMSGFEYMRKRDFLTENKTTFKPSQKRLTPLEKTRKD